MGKIYASCGHEITLEECKVGESVWIEFDKNGAKCVASGELCPVCKSSTIMRQSMKEAKKMLKEWGNNNDVCVP